MLSMESFDSDMLMHDLSLRVSAANNGVSSVPMAIFIRDYHGAEDVQVDVQYDASNGDEKGHRRMWTDVTTLLERMLSDPLKLIRDLEIGTDAERLQVVEEFNATESKVPSCCVHELFERQAKVNPGSTAVVFGKESLTYGELNRRSNRWAHHLREHGISPDDRVGLLVDRGFEMIVGLLAILKAGGAYVPLDPSYPRERLLYMVEDSAPKAVLTKKHLRDLLPLADRPVFELDEKEGVSGYPDTDLDLGSIGLTPNHLAYVIYTSGSTGQPKGVMIEHQGVSQLAQEMPSLFAVNRASRVLQ